MKSTHNGQFGRWFDASLEAVVQQVGAVKVVDDTPVSVAQREQRADGVVLAVGRVVVSRSVPEDTFQRGSPGDVIPGVAQYAGDEACLNVLVNSATECLFAELISTFQFPVPRSDDSVTIFDGLLAFPASSDCVAIAIDYVGVVVVFVRP